MSETIDLSTHRTLTGRWLRITERRTAEGGTVSVSVDITDLKNAEAAMTLERDKAEELARRAEAAEAVAGMGHWRVDAATREITWSPQTYKIYGFAPDQPLDLIGRCSRPPKVHVREQHHHVGRAVGAARSR